MTQNSIEIDSDEFESMVKKLRFLDGSSRALQSVQDKLEGLSYFFSGMVLSHDIDSILETGLEKFNEIVNTIVCSVFLLEEGGFEFSIKCLSLTSFHLLSKRKSTPTLILGHLVGLSIRGFPHVYQVRFSERIKTGHLIRC